MTITATNGEGTSDHSIARDGRSSEAGMLYLAKYVNNTLLHFMLVFLLIAAGVVEIASIVGTSDSTAVVFWTPPLQPNGAITGYQITYSLHEDSTDSINQAVTSNEDSYIIRNLS